MALQLSRQIESAVYSLQEGRFVLIHDSSKRENEVDMLVASKFVTPKHIAVMRKDAGGLICTCIEDQVGKNIGLRYAHDVLFLSNSFDTELKRMIYGVTPYGDHPTFSIWINHKNTRTGITDYDRALTVNTVASICDSSPTEQKSEFISSFKTPGHVPLLVAKEGLLKKRQGHTELSVFLVKLSGLTGSSTICEMVDSETHAALSVEKARKYSVKNKIPFIDLNEILEWAK